MTDMKSKDQKHVDWTGLELHQSGQAMTKLEWIEVHDHKIAAEGICSSSRQKNHSITKPRLEPRTHSRGHMAHSKVMP